MKRLETSVSNEEHANIVEFCNKNDISVFKFLKNVSTSTVEHFEDLPEHVQKKVVKKPSGRLFHKLFFILSTISAYFIGSLQLGLFNDSIVFFSALFL